MTGPAQDPRMRLRVGDAVVARVAARSARTVPGVVALRADLGQALLGFGRSVLGHREVPLPTDGVGAVVDDDTAEVTITLATRLGFNCRDLAQAVQRQVAADVGAYTGLEVAVRVVIVEVLLD